MSANMNPKSPSLTDIAACAGVSRMTVSCALRGTGRISPATISRIRAIARERGYTPDARLTEVMARVRETRRKEPVPIAWINGFENPNAYREYTWATPFIEGARERCLELGYKLDEFWLREPGMTERRMSSIIASRGIRGVIVGLTRPSVLRLRFDWRQFASVSFEGSILAPQLHRVHPDHHYNLLLTLKMLRRLGYRRIGLCVHRIIERRSHHAYLAALRFFQSGVPRGERVEPFVFEPFDQRGLARWLKRARPDAVVGHHAKLVEWLGTAGRRVPEDVGVAHLSLDGDCEDWAGIWQHKRRIGAQAVSQVVSLLHTGETGLPELAYETLVPGEWRFGKTLLRRTV
ncbi:LacI family transcriptional regulator [Opitutaceae bacterium TAV4]|nr:LacI family transcriptional regulator [Opitutaceae bacterium TAV4]RRK02671.1 LacI family transcriptional regulator [Opitutaceae bacterium TAV3]